MMKVTNFNTCKFILALFFIGGITSCNDDNGPDDFFDDTATERINEQEKEVYDLLQSSEQGWKVTYFTDDPRYTEADQELGGWTFLFNFTDNINVTMASDFSNETVTPQESEYEVKLGSTVKLSFTTASHIHLLSDGSNPPTSSLAGQGYKGDFEFLFYEQDGEDLIFRSNRDQIELRFQKATAEDWDSLEEARTMLSLFSNADPELEINDGEGVETYGLNYGANTRFMANSDDSSLSFGIAPKADGLKVVNPIPVGNEEEATDFTYDAANNWFIAELSDNKTVKIVLEEPEPTYHLFEEQSALTFQLVQDLLNAPTTNAFIAIYEQSFISADEELGYRLQGFFLSADANQIQYLFEDEDGGSIYAIHNITYTVDSENNRIIMSDNGWDGTDGDTYGSILQPLDDLLLDPEGFIMVDGIGTIQGYPAFSMRSYANPDVEFVVLGGF